MTKDSLIGTHVLAELHDCRFDHEMFADHQALAKSLTHLVTKHGLTPLGSTGHTFPDGGITCVILLAESHLAVHTWVETKFVTLDVFVCNYHRDNSERAKALFDELIPLFHPSTKSVHVVERG